MISLKNLSAVPTLIGSFLSPPIALAYTALYGGTGLKGGIDAAAGVTGVSTADPRAVVINIITTVLDFAALLAFVMVVIAGFYLVLSLGNDDGKDKAKKIIYYTLIGLVVLLFSRVIVGLVTVWLASKVS